MDENEKQHETHADGRFTRARDPLGSMRTIETQCLDFCPICRTADVLRATMPPEFSEHWQAWQREALEAARTLLDHYLERLESQRPSTPVEDIPIE